MNRFLLMMICVVVSLHAQHSEDLFSQGNKHFVKAEFSEAIAAYHQIENPSALVLMNMGISYFNMQKYAQARLAFVQAQKKSDGALFRNINRLQKQLDERLGFETQKKYHNLFLDGVYLFSTTLLQLFIIFSFLLILYSVFFKKTVFYQTIVYSLFFMNSFAWLYRYQSNRERLAVVMVDSDLYAGPDLLFLKKNMIPLGKVFKSIAEKEHMVQIVKNEQQGWISSKNITLV